jgi:DNA protecting protein DprA
MNSVERRVVAALWSVPGIGFRSLEEIRKSYPDLRELLRAPMRSWVKRVTLTPQAQRQLAGHACLSDTADALDEALARCGQRALFHDDPEWPLRREGMVQSPAVLFTTRKVLEPLSLRRLAIVGTRHPEHGVVERVAALACELARAGVAIVSGGAEGVDRAAHGGAVAGGGQTAAFLGQSIDRADGALARFLAAIQEHGGAVFTEYPPGTRASRCTFPRRNRLIAGAAEATLVARAGEKSGALYTAAFCLKQGTPLFAIPGDPWNPCAKGSNQLLANGEATICLSAAHLLAALGLGVREATEKKHALVRSSLLSTAAAHTLSLVEEQPQDFDAILLRGNGMPSGALAAALVELELAGLVVRRAGRRYQRMAASKFPRFVDDTISAN